MVCYFLPVHSQKAREVFLRPRGDRRTTVQYHSRRRSYIGTESVKIHSPSFRLQVVFIGVNI